MCVPELNMAFILGAIFAELSSTSTLDLVSALAALFQSNTKKVEISSLNLTIKLEIIPEKKSL